MKEGGKRGAASVLLRRKGTSHAARRREGIYTVRLTREEETIERREVTLAEDTPKGEKGG